MPNVKPPEELETVAEVLQRVLDNRPDLTQKQRAYLQERVDNYPENFDVKPIDADRCARLEPHDATYRIWVKAKQPIGPFFFF